jgi:hypothetical protein
MEDYEMTSQPVEEGIPYIVRLVQDKLPKFLPKPVTSTQHALDDDSEYQGSNAQRKVVRWTRYENGGRNIGEDTSKNSNYGN